MTADAKDVRIAELEAELIARDRRIAKLEAEGAAKNARIDELEQQVDKLTAQVAALLEHVAELTEKLGQHSRNSHLPPSSDGPGRRPGRKKGNGKSKHRHGGQKGHRGSRRELLPPEQVDEFVPLFASACENCWKPLPKIADPNAKRYQVTELPPFRPHTTEYQRHTVGCPCCGFETQASSDEIPVSSFGPRLMSTIALLTGVYHLSRRKAVELLSDVTGTQISLGGLSNVEARVADAVEPAVTEAWEQVERDAVKHTDGTTWLQAGVALSLWTIATAMATVFKILKNGSKETLKPLYGALLGILISDRATALNFWAMERRQICWAHLLRKFVSFSERDGPAGKIGEELVAYTALVFDYWHGFKEGRLSRAELQVWMEPVRKRVKALLQRAVDANIKRLSGSCKDILKHKAALWTFVDHEGVEPTNNHAERELRGFVLWRKRSFGTQSARGNRFAENLMTVAHTARKQNRNVLEFLTACCEAHLAKAPPPSLFAREVAVAA